MILNKTEKKIIKLLTIMLLNFKSCADLSACKPEIMIVVESAVCFVPFRLNLNNFVT